MEQPILLENLLPFYFIFLFFPKTNYQLCIVFSSQELDKDHVKVSLSVFYYDISNKTSGPSGSGLLINATGSNQIGM